MKPHKQKGLFSGNIEAPLGSWRWNLSGKLVSPHHIPVQRVLFSESYTAEILILSFGKSLSCSHTSPTQNLSFPIFKWALNANFAQIKQTVFKVYPGHSKYY